MSLKKFVSTFSTTRSQQNAPVRRRLKRVWHHSQSVVLPATAIVLLGLLWEGSVYFFEIPVYLLPAPSVIWTDFIVQVELVLGHSMATVGTILSGFALSIAISFPLTTST